MHVRRLKINHCQIKHITYIYIYIYIYRPLNERRLLQFVNDGDALSKIEA
jgi:hypothetical protein